MVPPIDKEGTYKFDVPSVPLTMGAVSYNTLPGANVSFFLGEEKVLETVTPVKTDLPVGKYKVKIENSLLGIKTERDFVVEENKLNRDEITLDLKK